MDTLFAHLATRFAASSENIAIEALGFVLARSVAARAALRELAGLGSGAGSLPAEMTFATQAGVGADDAARPDIEGYGPDLARCCIVECKFWAGLTANQPLTYAARLPAGAPGSLVFIVPSARLTALWAELTRRLVAGGYEVGRRRAKGAETWFTSFGSDGAVRHGFVLVSWRVVLASIMQAMQAMQAAGETEHVEDVRQLAGLCERMDAEAFLPLKSEEVTSVEQPRRYLQLAQLAFDIGTALVDAGAAEAKTSAGTKLTAGGGAGFYGRNLFAHGVTFFLAFDCALWAAHRTSPIWIRVDAQRYPQAAARLKQQGETMLGCDAVAERNQSVAVPVPIRFGIERPDIVEEAVAFCASVVALFQTELPNNMPAVSAAGPSAV